MPPIWFLYTAAAMIIILTCTAPFFFTLTRGALILRSAMGSAGEVASHVYPIYSNMRLIRLIDFRPVIAAILLFQYDRLVTAITQGLHRMDLSGKTVLITSCAFGNVIPRVVAAATESGASRVLIADILLNELKQAQTKLPDFARTVEYLEENPSAMSLADRSVDANMIFFLLHELPHDLKGAVLSWTYFKVFEPLGLALLDTHDPVRQLKAMEGFTCERRAVFFGNFQVIVATRDPAT